MASKSSRVEFWRPIQGFEGYDVSSFGRVRTWIRNAQGTPIRRGKLFAATPKIMKTDHTDGSGYPYVSIYDDKAKRRCPKVHRLVANAFIPNPNKFPEVNHLSGLKADNRSGNLEHTTHLENIRHAIATGLHDYKKPYGDGRSHAGIRVSDASVREMQRLYWEEGIKPSELARIFRVPRGGLADLVYGLKGRGKRLMEGTNYGNNILDS